MCRWLVPLSRITVTAHNIRAYRDQLAFLTEDQVSWQPYLGFRAPFYCTQGQDLWRARVPLICFDRVEWHFPDRVMRQFGMLQSIPKNCDTEEELHDISRQGRAKTDFVKLHRKYLLMWNSRDEMVEVGQLGEHDMVYTDPYMLWYRSITRSLIQNPSHTEDAGFRARSSCYEGLVSYILCIIFLHFFNCSVS